MSASFDMLLRLAALSQSATDADLAELDRKLRAQSRRTLVSYAGATSSTQKQSARRRPIKSLYRNPPKSRPENRCRSMAIFAVVLVQKTSAFGTQL
jgi:hypothetical protein